MAIQVQFLASTVAVIVQKTHLGFSGYVRVKSLVPNGAVRGWLTADGLGGIV
jgi:hypothetical protein